MVIETPAKEVLLAAAEKAAAQGLHVITDGNQVLISPIVPPGWFRMITKVKPQPMPQEGTRCAA